MSTTPLASLATLTLPDQAQLTSRAQAALRMVESMTIESADDYEMAGEELRAIKAKAGQIEKQRTGITGPINQALKAINDLFRGPADYLANAEKIIKDKMLGYTTEQERIAAEQRRQAEEAAAAERRRLDEQARQAREAAAAEQRRIAEAEAERQRAARAEQQRIEREAAEAKARGDAEAAARAHAEAERKREADAAAAAHAEQLAATAAQNAAAEVAAIEQVAQVITAPVVVAAPVKAAGISTAKGFDFEVVDVVALIKDVAAKVDAQPGLAAVLTADSVKLRALVKALGKNLGLAGVRVFEKRTMRAAA